MRTKIYNTYRPGQCDDWNISKEYSSAAKECILFIANKEGVEPNLRIYEMLEPKE